MGHAISGNNALILADALERAYRLALGLEGVTRKQSLKRIRLLITLSNG